MYVQEDLPKVTTAPIWQNHSWGLMVTPTQPVDTVGWADANAPVIGNLIDRYGALLFRGFRVDDPRIFESFSDSVVRAPFVAYREAATPRKHVQGNIFTSTEYPPDFRIYVHNENSHVTSWPMYLFFHCRIAPDEGGATPLADCRAVYDGLPGELVYRFSQQGWLYRRNFSSHSSIPWQTAFNLDSRAALEAYCRENRIRPTWSDSGLTIRYRRWATVRHPKTGDMLWFNHGLFFNPYSLEPIFKEAMEGMSEDEIVSNTYYGDGASIDEATLRMLDAAYEAETAYFRWQPGDILMVDNMRIAHGRQPYSGKRQVLVAMKSDVSGFDLDECQRFLQDTGSSSSS